MKLSLRILPIFLFFPTLSFGQAKYFVYFKDKPVVSISSLISEFHPKARERREKNGLPMITETDIPVNEEYSCQVGERVLTLRHCLRWLNAVSVEATSEQIASVAVLPFVLRVEPFSSEAELTSFPSSTVNRFDTLLTLVRRQMNLDLLLDSNLTGKGIRIAILDAGFQDADIHPAMERVRQYSRIVATKDFYEGDDNVYEHSLHGMQVLSCIAGMYEGRALGAAMDAEFLLARVEHETKEIAAEEDHWIAAAEWADKLGADIISSSVTYTDKRYTYADMDGKTAPVSRAAAIAVQKGMVVVCSMGNEGDEKWRYMGAPADVPGVLSVGGSLPVLPMRNPFSSIGPNVLNQRKPDISAPGFVLSAIKKDQYGENAGTSFSTPLIAGVAACMIQRYPEKTQAEIFDLLCHSGHFYPYYDYELGYGIADMARILATENDSIFPTFEVIHRSDSVILKMDMAYMYRDSTNFPNGRVLYYHLENEEGYLGAYFTIRLKNNTRYYFFRRRETSHGILRIWLGGYLYEERI
ncbi:MAG: S8 family serine peptidase [Bacteroidia bacterium]|nr:S8 family serine peptidase [Bacteroidia bacterium]